MENIMFSTYKNLPKSINILFAQRVIMTLGEFVFPMLTILLSDRLGQSDSQIGFYMMLMSFATIPGAVIAGHLCDKYSRKAIMVTACLIAAGLFIICGFFTNSIVIIYLIIFSEFFLSFAYVASNAMMTDLTTPENRKEGFSLIYLGINLGLAVGCLLAGFMYRHSVPLLFILDGISTALSILLVLFFVPDSKPDEEAINEINNSDRVNEKSASGNAALLILKNPILLCYIVSFFTMIFAYSSFGFVVPLELTSLHGADSAATLFGIVISVNAVTVIIGTPITTRIMKNAKTAHGLIIACVAYIIGFGIMVFTSNIIVMFIAVFIWTIGEILSSICGSTFLANHSPVTHRGRVGSVQTITRGLARGLSPFVLGLILEARSFSFVWLVVCTLAFVAMLVLLYMNHLDRPIKATSEPVSSQS